jgi:hypothetical protein
MEPLLLASALIEFHLPPSEIAEVELPVRVRQSDWNRTVPDPGGGGGGGGGSVTVMLEVPDTSAVLAVMVAVPALTPVTTPLVLTRAIPTLLLLQTKVWPGMTVPSALNARAVNCVVAPASTLAVAGETVTRATVGGGGGGSVTVILALPATPLVVAVMLAEPAPTAVTSPAAFTVADCGLLLVHANVRSGTTRPLASRALAVSCTV